MRAGYSSIRNRHTKQKEHTGSQFPVRIIAGETIVEAVLYDNATARAFAEMMPLTVDLWTPIHYAQAKSDVLPFIRNPASLNMWSKEFFQKITENLFADKIGGAGKTHSDTADLYTIELSNVCTVTQYIKLN